MVSATRMRVTSGTYILVLIALLVLVALTRLFTFTVLIPLAPPDATDYWLSIPNSLAADEGYKGCNPDYFLNCSAPVETAAREPVTVFLYAAIIRVFGWHMNIMFAFQVVLDVLSAIFIYRIAARLFSSGIGLASVALWAIYLPAITLVGVLHWSPTTTLVIALFIDCVLWALETTSWRRFIAAGVLFGLLCLARSSYLYSLILWLPLLWLASGNWRRGLRNSAVFGAAALIFIFPWVVRNYQVFNAFIPGTTLNGYNLFRHNYVIEDPRALWYGDAKSTRAALAARLADGLTGTENEAQLDKLYRDEALKVIGTYPGRYLELVVSRLADGWFNIRASQNYLSDSIFGYFNAIFDVLFHAVLLFFCVPALLVMSKRQLNRVWPILLLLVFSTVVYLPVTVRLDYLVPVAPYLFMVACYGLTVVRQYRQQSLA